MALVEAYEAGDAEASAMIRRHIEDAIAFTRRYIRASGGVI
jgi:DNA-binding GntR family transcriptional regulator